MTGSSQVGLSDVSDVVALLFAKVPHSPLLSKTQSLLDIFTWLACPEKNNCQNDCHAAVMLPCWAMLLLFALKVQ